MYLRTLSVLSRYLLFPFPVALGLLPHQRLGMFELFPDRDAPLFGAVQRTPGVFRKTACDGVRLFCLEQQQIFSFFHRADGVVNAPLPGHPVKLPGIAGEFHAAGVPAVAQELSRALLSLGRLPSPLGLADFPGRRTQHLGEAPRRQLSGPDGDGDGAAGHFFIDQANRLLSGRTSGHAGQKRLLSLLMPPLGVAALRRKG